MKYKNILGTDLNVSRICLGTMTFGTPVGENEAVELVHWALDHGVNLMDTANIYEGYDRIPGSPGGRAESILGAALQGGRRQRTVIMTKVGNPVGPGPEDTGLSAPHIQREIDKSLQRLKTDYIDVYFLHRPDPQTPLIETIQTMNQLIDAGKIKHYGVSNFSVGLMREITSVCDANGFKKPVVSQPPYSLLRRDIEKEELAFCAEQKISLTVYQPLQGGLLAGKYVRGGMPPPGSRKSEKPKWVWELNDALFDELETIQRLAESIQSPMSQYAIAWVLARPGVVSAVVGVKTVNQLKDNIEGVELEFPQEHLALLDLTHPANF
ncbi:MAG: aldo/keto reductase [Candidatus Omnitrophica bacterium]|nr:aldo/keto reductase [Candidatus Omnitrophota bacterium]